MTGARPEPGELMPVAQSPQLASARAALLETVLNGAPADSDTPAPAAEGSDATRAKTRAAFELADTTGLAAAPHLVEAMMEQPQADGIETYRRVIGSNPHACPAALGLATLGSAAAPYVLQQMQAVLEAEAPTDGEAMRSARLVTACDLLGNLVMGDIHFLVCQISEFHLFGGLLGNLRIYCLPLLVGELRNFFFR